MNTQTYYHWQTHHDAIRIEEAVSRELLVSVAEMRARFGDVPAGRFDEAVLMLADQRRICVFGDRSPDAVKPGESVYDGRGHICYLAPKCA